MKSSHKYSVIERYRDQYRITALCEFFEVSRSGYYAYLKRIDSEKDRELVEKIRLCQQQTDSTYGYRRVCIWLDRQGIHVNHKRVYRLMEQYGLLAQIRRKRKYQRMSEQLHRYPNLLNRNFSASRPNEKWVTDISYIPTPEGTLYLSIIRDLYDNSIVAYKQEQSNQSTSS